MLHLCRHIKKALFASILFLIFIARLDAQVSKAEYFIDVDPGFGQAVSIPITAAIDLPDRTASINLTTVGNGFHNLFIRTQDINGRWSVTNQVPFYKTANASVNNVTRVEYFFDTDPGFGKATSIGVSSSPDISSHVAGINLSTIDPGFHTLFIRSRDADGKWSVTNQVPFYKTGGASGNIVTVEYFLDIDPGFGKATVLATGTGSNLADQPATIDLSASANGFHTLFIRSKDANGKWSMTNQVAFFKTSAAAVQNILVAEYFVDTDPGFGKASQIPIVPALDIADQSATINLSNVGNGLHRLFIRTLAANGKWSITNTDTFRLAAINSPGQVGTNQAICSNVLPGLLTNVSLGTSSTDDLVVYQWQDSTIGGTWQNVAASTDSMYQPPSLSISTWYRRKVTAGTYTAFSNEISITVTPVAGDPSIFPVNTWNVYAYNGSDVSLGGGLFYRGFYSVNALNLNSTNEWANTLSPSFATGYQGCAVNTDQFTWVYKRKGFPAGDYILNSTGIDDLVQVLVNGVQVYQAGNAAAFNNITLGHLDANATIEIRCAETTGMAFANVSLVISALQSGVIAGNQTGCAGFTPALLTNVTAAFGGPSTTIVYQWQDSTIGSTWKNINNATQLTFQPPVLTSTTWYRRIATSGTSSAFTNEVELLVIPGVPNLLPGVTISNRTLTASPLAAGTTGWQWYKNDVGINGATNQNFTVADAEFGQYSVAYTNSCGSGNTSAPVMVSITKTNQTITFTSVPAKAFGDAPFVVNASASSDLPISSYSIESGPATINGSMVTISGAGVIVVKATQDGNTTFNSAANTLTIVVNKAAASISLSNLLFTYDGTPKSATAVTMPLGLNAQITYDGSPSAPSNAGSYAVVATITSPNYSGNTTGTMVIGKADQTITVINPGNKRFSDASFAVSATATSGLPVSLSIVTVPASGVATIIGNTITLLGAGGTVTINGAQPGNSNYNAAPAVSTSFAVDPPAANDLQMVKLVTPVDGCNTGLIASITINIRNAGTATAANFPVSYKIGNEHEVTETFTSVIAAGSSADFTFVTKGIFAQTGVAYSIQLYTAIPGDERLGNDTLMSSVSRFAPPVFGVSNDTAICFGDNIVLRTFGASVSQWTNGPTSNQFTVAPAITTTYTVVVRDANACSTETLDVTVLVNAVPVVNAGLDVAILKGSSTTLQATGADSYQWSNGTPTATNTVSPAATTTYAVTGTNAQGCKATDEVTVQVNFSSIAVSPGIVQFGAILIDSTSKVTLTVTNTGTLTETLTSITGAQVPFGVSFTTPVSLPPGTSVQVPVSFSPTATLIFQNKITVATSAGNFDVTLRGTGVNAAPAWTVTPASFNFGKIATNTNTTQNLLIKNTGNVAIRISSVSSSSPRFTGSTSGVLDIPVGGTINLAVRFSPNAIAAFNGTITVRTSTAGLSLLRAIVAGVGFVPGPTPTVEYVGQAPFDGQGGVSPKVGQPGFYTYSIVYKSPGNIAPKQGSPTVGIDKNSDGDFADEDEGTFTLTKAGSTSNWITGEVYSFTTYLTASELYGYQFFATDANNNEATLAPFASGPIVTREILDLHIFASDITFSKTNPAVNENFTVTATIHNNSPYATTDVPLQFFYKDSLFLFNDTIAAINGNSSVSVTHTLNFSPDGFYPIKVWIDSSNTLGEGNLLNNYASRPVIVGNFSVPGTIDVVSNATPSGCNKGRVTYSGRANYRGLNLTGTPPVEGAEVTITVMGFASAQIIKTTTDINGNWYYYHDPCAEDPDDIECTGYACGITYNYTVEVTDFTLTSPIVAGSSNRPCTNCNPVATMRNGIGVSGCILDGAPYTIGTSVANFEFDILGRRICAPTAYNDTITVYVDGQLVTTYTLDSIVPCGAPGFTFEASGLSTGNHSVSMNHTYYFANGERVEQSVSSGFTVLPIVTDITLSGITKTGHTSFDFADRITTCGVGAGEHMVYLYDSLPGFAENILIDSFNVSGIPASNGGVLLSYSNPTWAVGNHYLTIVTDVKNVIPELQEDNNILTAVFYVQEPDLLVKNLKASNTTGTAGSQMNFSANVINVGSAINQPFAVQFRINGTLLGAKINLPSLGTNDTAVVVSAPFTVPVSLCAVQATIFVDSDSEIQEFNESNNVDTTQFGVNINAGRSCTDDQDETVGAGFYNDEDPLATVLCTPYIAPKGVLTYFATTVRNTGSRDARSVKVIFKLNGEELGTDVIPLLKAGQKTESGFYYAFDTLGRFIIDAFADYTKEICEVDEKDNIGFIHIDIRRSVPDLEVLSQYIAPGNLNPMPGQLITVVGSVVNKGDAPSTPSVMRFWVNDLQLGADIPIDTLFPGQDTTVMATVSYSSNIVGPKILKLTADVTKLVAERRESNNEATRAIIVGAAPDLSRSMNEAITLLPQSFNVGDTITIRNYLRNYGGEGGAAWLRFFYRNSADEKILIDSVRFAMESNDSGRIGIRWKVVEGFGQIITEIGETIPPEFNELNNIDSLPFQAALPLTLLSFNGTVNKTEALLQWLTTNEDNVHHFELERSNDGNRFIKRGTTPAKNTAGQHRYLQTDNDFGSQPGNVVFYRLKIVDNDGAYRYSHIVRLNKTTEPAYVKVYPNPVKSILYLQVTSLQQGSYNLQVIDATGKVCTIKKYAVVPGTQTLSLPVQMLPQGWYVLMMQQPDGSTKQVKFIKD